LPINVIPVKFPLPEYLSFPAFRQVKPNQY